MSAARRPSASFLQVAKAVFWSFLGIRKRAEHEADMVRLNPVHVIIAGILGGILFVLTIIFVVHLVISRVAGG
jgi:hypothetical protein